MYSFHSVIVDGALTERTVLPHGDVLLASPVVAGGAGPQGGQVHQRPPSHHTDREPSGAGRADSTGIRDHRLAHSAF